MYTSASFFRSFLQFSRTRHVSRQTHFGRMRILKDMTCRRDYGQRFSQRPVRFGVPFPLEHNIAFRDKLSADVVFVDGEAVLHTVSTATIRFAAFCLGRKIVTFRKLVERTWLACVLTRYLVFPATVVCCRQLKIQYSHQTNRSI